MGKKQTRVCTVSSKKVNPAGIDSGPRATRQVESTAEAVGDTMKTIVVTRHNALVEYLREQGVIGDDTPVLAHASISDIKGKHVIGVLPHHLSQHAAVISEVPMSLTPDDRKSMQRGDLTLERTRAIAGPIVSYQVFGGSQGAREQAIALAADEPGCSGWSPKTLERKLWRTATEFLTGARSWHEIHISNPKLILVAVGITISSVNGGVDGPVLDRNLQLRAGWSEHAPRVPMKGTLGWEGDGNHAGAEVDFDTMGVRAYAAGPGWTDWIFPYGQD